MTLTQPKKMGPTDCITPIFRASYPTLFEARAADLAKPNDKNFGVEMWFRVRHTPESQAAQEEIVSIKPLEDAAQAACVEEWGADQAKWPTGFKHPPFVDGDTKAGKNGPVPGCIVVRAKRKESFGRPVVVDQNVKDIMDKDAIYAGCYCRAKIHAYAWKHPTGGPGVSFTLDMIQLDHDGEPLGSRMEAADAFQAIPMPAGAGVSTSSPSAPPANVGRGSIFGTLG